MRREVFFLKAPNAHVKFRMEAIQAVQESLFGNLSKQEKGERYVELAQEQLKLVIAGYSRGDDLNRLRMWFGEVMHSWKQARKLDAAPPDLYSAETYHTTIWTLSLARLFAFDDETIYQLVRDLDLVGKDMFIDLLLPDLLKRSGKGLMHPEPYKTLVEASKDDPQQVGHYVSNFLRNYYAQQQTCSWYDTHIKHEPQFFGYWSFELALLVKEYGWLDRDFTDNIFYPRDLVAPQMYRTWLDDTQGAFDRNQVRDIEASALDIDALAEALKQQAGGEAPDPEALLKDLTGLGPEEYADQPDKLLGTVRQLLKALAASTRQMQEAAKGNTEDYADLLKQVDQLEREIGQAEKGETEFKDGAAEKLAAPYKELGEELETELQASEGTEPMVFLERMVGLMEKFDGLIEVVPNREVEKRVADELGARLAERRKARGGGKFDLNDLLN